MEISSVTSGMQLQNRRIPSQVYLSRCPNCHFPMMHHQLSAGQELGCPSSLEHGLSRIETHTSKARLGR
eukprot:2658689-Rhodomonas_salina.2